jgi:hypothetical protein
MSLTDRLNKQDRRDPQASAHVVPIRERRIPEWRKRALEAQQRTPWAAVTDLTDAA